MRKSGTVKTDQEEKKHGKGCEQRPSPNMKPRVRQRRVRWHAGWTHVLPSSTPPGSLLCQNHPPFFPAPQGNASVSALPFHTLQHASLASTCHVKSSRKWSLPSASASNQYTQRPQEQAQTAEVGGTASGASLETSLVCWSSGTDPPCNARDVGLLPGLGTRILGARAAGGRGRRPKKQPAPHRGPVQPDPSTAHRRLEENDEHLGGKSQPTQAHRLIAKWTCCVAVGKLLNPVSSGDN